MACTPQDLVTAASRFQGIPTGMQTNVATAVACQLAGISADAQSLVDAARCIDGCKTEPILLAIAAVCNLSSGLSVTLPDDADAAAFVCGWLNICAAQTGDCTSTTNCAPGTPVPFSATCASFCGISQKTVNAVSDLVTSLKSAGLWNLMDVIYPFMGGNSGACSLNLKDPTKFAITWHGGVTFSSAGVTGNGTSGYGDTGFDPSVSGVNFTLNSAGMGCYINGTNQADFIGAFSIITVGSALTSGATGIVGRINDPNPNNVGPIAYGSPAAGHYTVNRTAANLTTLYVPAGTTATDATAPSSLTAFSLYVLSAQFSGIPNSYSNATMGFAWAGTGLDGAQVATLDGIINTFIAAK